MSQNVNGHTPHAEYDFKWCPGCGDFGVRRAIEFALADYNAKTGKAIEDTVLVTGIGCSGNLVHMMEGPQPYGFHGIHGRTLPIAFGVKMSRPDLNVLTVAGDGDFLAIGAEHIAPQAARNLDITAVVLDNGIYGLTKGQSSPTTHFGAVTSSTPFGKLETEISPLDLYLAYGVSYIACGYSSKPKDLAKLILGGMEHRGFSIIHIMSPCVTYNDTYEVLKGNAKKGIEPAIMDVSADHDPSDRQAAYKLIHSGKIPVGVVYKRDDLQCLHQRMDDIRNKTKVKSVEELLNAYRI